MAKARTASLSGTWRTGLVALVVFVAACGSTGHAPPETTPPPTNSPEGASSPEVSEASVADSVRHAYTEADVAFMQGMIHHHAQALVMSRMAPTHGASEAIRNLTARIINSQNDEIALMQRWLENNGERVPRPSAIDPHDHGGEPMKFMPGMLTDEQMAALEAARGPAFDRQFLIYMIQHHQGAITMVDDLFSGGGGREESVFRLASDIAADQKVEIDRMQEMLRTMVFETSG